MKTERALSAKGLEEHVLPKAEPVPVEAPLGFPSFEARRCEALSLRELAVGGVWAGKGGHVETPLAGEAQGRWRSCRLMGTPYHGSLGLPEQGPGGREGEPPEA